MENKNLKEVEFYVTPISKFNSQSFPVIEEKKVLVNDKILEAIRNKTKCFDLENNCVIDYDNTEDLERERIEKLRRLREPLLIAFDKYKTNVNYGIEIETQEEKELIVNWYKAILDLDGNAILNVPEKIKYYL